MCCLFINRFWSIVILKIARVIDQDKRILSRIMHLNPKVCEVDTRRLLQDEGLLVFINSSAQQDFVFFSFQSCYCFLAILSNHIANIYIYIVLVWLQPKNMCGVVTCSVYLGSSTNQQHCHIHGYVVKNTCNGQSRESLHNQQTKIISKQFLHWRLICQWKQWQTRLFCRWCWFQHWATFQQWRHDFYEQPHQGIPSTLTMSKQQIQVKSIESNVSSMRAHLLFTQWVLEINDVVQRDNHAHGLCLCDWRWLTQSSEANQITGKKNNQV